MAKTFPLNIVIGAVDKATAKIRAVQNRVADITKPLQRVSRSVLDFSEKIGLNRVGQEALAVGKVLLGLQAIAGITGGALGLFAIRTSQAADAINDQADRLQIGKTALQEYTYAFKFFGVEAEQTVDALDSLNKNLGDAKINMGRAVPIFRGLGIDPKNFKNASDLMPVLADRLSRITDTAKRAAIAERLLGTYGAQMATLLGEGSDELARFRQRAHEVGAVLSDETLEGAGRLNDMLDALSLTVRGVVGNMMGRLYPALAKIAENLQAVFVRYQPNIVAWADELGKNLPGHIDRLVALFKALAAAVAPFITAISWVVDNFGAANTLLATLAAIIGGKLIAAVVALGFNLAALGVSMTVAFGAPALIVAGVLAAVAAGYYLIKNWDKIKSAFAAIIDSISKWFSSLWDGIKAGAVAAVNWIAEKFKWLVDHHPLVMAFRGVRSLLGGGAQAQASAVPGAAPIADRLLNMPAAQTQRVEVSVDLNNLPPGTRADANTTGGIPLELNRGYAMPGVR